MTRSSGAREDGGLTSEAAGLAEWVSAQQADESPDTAHWVRVTRSGNKLAGYTSEDGETWVQFGFETIELTETVQVGFWVAGQAAALAAHVDNVTLGPVVDEPVAPETRSELPEPWQRVTLGEGTGSSSYTADTETFDLTAQGVGNTPTTHFVYQSVSGDVTLIARVQNLDAIDQAAAAGLMLREDTSPESAYAFLALTPQGIRFESREGGSTDVARVEGPSASAPVWLKLERKEGNIYAYESDDGLNWAFVTTVAIQLSAPTYFGLAAHAVANPMTVEFQVVNVLHQNGSDSLKQVPYTINSAEIQGATEILAAGQPAYDLRSSWSCYQGQVSRLTARQARA